MEDLLVDEKITQTPSPRRPGASPCVMTNVMAIIGGKWKMLILYNLCSGPMRYGELKRRLPHCTEKMLIQSLRELEADRIISRRQYNEVPPRVDYLLTEEGQALHEALQRLVEWGKVHAGGCLTE